MSQSRRPRSVGVVLRSTLVVLGVTLSFSLPGVALAHNCPSLAGGEIEDCLKKNFDANLALIGFALGAVGAAAAARSSRPPTKAPRMEGDFGEPVIKKAPRMEGDFGEPVIKAPPRAGPTGGAEGSE